MWFIMPFLCAIFAPMNVPEYKILILCDKNERPQMEFLKVFFDATASFERRECRIEDQPEKIGDLTPYNAVFMYLHAVMNEQIEERLINYAKNGGRLIVLHHGIASAKRANPNWLSMLGISIPPSEGVERPWKVLPNMDFYLVNFQPKHFVTSYGVVYDATVDYKSSESNGPDGSFPALKMQNTEIFLNQISIDGDSKQLLLGISYIHPETGKLTTLDHGAWMKSVGKGTVFYFQTGHCKSDFKNPGFRHMLLNALKWRP